LKILRKGRRLMERQFHDIYDNLYREYGDELSPTQAELPQEIRVRIDNAIDELYLSERIRPDAKLYLLVNFHRLVVMPLLEGGSFSTDEDFDYLSDDVGILLRRARDLADSREAEEISGHLMVDALSEVWDELRLLGADPLRFFW
jgi:hypothetical protein